MARKKDEQPAKPVRKEERKAKASQKAPDGGAPDRYLQPTDQHYISFKQQLAVMGLMLRDVPGDGNCLFRALNDQLEGHSRNHQRLRDDTVRFMIEHREDFEPFVEDDVPFLEHVNRLRQLGTYGGHDALVAFARMHKVTIIIHQLNEPLWQIEDGPAGCQQLHLSYHNGEHYSSIRRVGDTSESSANIRINVAVSDSPQTSASGVKKGTQGRRFKHKVDFTNERIRDEAVQKIAGKTGCKDLTLIGETLKDFNGDEDAATDYLTSLVLATDPNENGVVDGADVGADSAAASTYGSREAENASTLFPIKLKPADKKLTNKERKEQNRLEKQIRTPNDQQLSTDHYGGHVSDAVVIDAAVACLRI